MRIKFLIALFITVLAVGFVHAGQAEAIMVTGTWNGCVNGTMSLHLDDANAPQEYYAITGKFISSIQYPVTGTAIFDTSQNVYRMSLFSTSASGETFTWGMQINPETMTGSGNWQRIAHGVVDADCAGTLTAISIE